MVFSSTDMFIFFSVFAITVKKHRKCRVIMDEETEEQLQQKLMQLQEEHRDLDEVIERLLADQPVDMFQLQRLKKRKLSLKDMMQRIESELLPDIIA